MTLPQLNRSWIRRALRPRMESLEARVTPATFVVNNTIDGGPGSLRQAIDDANGTGGADEITFDFAPGSGLQTFTLTTPLSDILEAVTIKGYTHPDAKANTLAQGSDAALMIEVTNGGGVTRGFHIVASDVRLEGLIINGFAGDGIAFDGGIATGSVAGCWVGLNATGTAAKANTSSGVALFNGAVSVTIGGPNPGDRNVISGNSQQGVFAGGNVASSAVVVRNNYIGTNPAGTAKINNGQDGIRFDGVSDSAINGNLIAGNTNHGIQIRTGPTAGRNSTNITINGNTIGTDVTATSLIANGNASTTHAINVVQVTSNSFVENVTIGGPTVADRNIISGQALGSGIHLGQFTRKGLVEGNYIGLNGAGTAAIGNGTGGTSGRGIWIDRGHDWTIRNNVVGGSTSDGILMDNRSYNNVVVGNLIGLNAAGNAKIGNAAGGIAINGASYNNRVGGTTAADRNVSSGNRDGVYINGYSSQNNVVQGNYLGTDVTGMIAIGNTTAGLRMNNTFGNTIGGSGAGEANLVAGNPSGITNEAQAVPGNFASIQWKVADGGNDHWYVVNPQTLTWQSARTAAVSLGGDLVNIADLSENDFLVNNVNGNVGGLKLNITAWTGLNDIALEGNYEFIDAPGVPLGFAPTWVTGEPNNFGDDEDFGTIAADGKWNDNGLHEHLRAVMEFTTLPSTQALVNAFYPRNIVQGNTVGLKADGTALPNANAGVTIGGAAPRVLVGTNGDGLNDAAERNVISGNTNQGVSIVDTSNFFSLAHYDAAGGGNGHYYLMPNTTLTWAAADTVAKSVGGQLVSIGSAGENAFIHTNFTLPFNIDAWLGLTDNETYGGAEFGNTSAAANRGEGFVWTDGTLAPYPSGYSNWNAGEPNNSPDEDFILMTNAGGWNDLGATGTRRFIIEFNDFATAKSAMTTLVGNLRINVEVAGNNIGVGADGTTAIPNGANGVLVNTGLNATIKNNIIAGNTGNGVRIEDISALITIANNKIGVLADGTTAKANGGSGVVIVNSSTNFITNNTISGNLGDGVQVIDKSRLNLVQNNRIGVAADGKSAVGNGGRGVTLRADASQNIVGTDLDGTNDAGERNIIAGNASHGVAVDPFPLVTLQWKVADGGNDHYYIVYPRSLFPNDAQTLAKSAGGDLVSVGSANESNFIIANLLPIAAGLGDLWIGFSDDPLYGGTEFGNTSALPNRGEGWVWMDGTPPPYPIGGPLTGFMNWSANEPNNSTNENYASVINGGANNGKWNDLAITQKRLSLMEFVSPTGISGLRGIIGSLPNRVQGNLIGVGSDSTTLVANGGDGVFVDDAPGALIGGAAVGAGNVIRGNAGNGVTVIGNSSAASIRGNSISDNGKLGIDLGNDGVTANDAGDADLGPNGLLNFPALTKATDGAVGIVDGNYNGLADTNFTIEFFANAALDPSGNGEGARLLGSGNFKTDATGNATFSVGSLGAITLGEFVTAVVVAPDGASSEFSNGVQAGGVATPPAKVASVKIDDGSSQRSLVRSLTVTFDQKIDSPLDPTAFVLTRQGGGAVTIAAALDVTGKIATLTFTGGDVDFASLKNGRYNFSINAAKVTTGGGTVQLDGDADGFAGGNYVLNSAASPAPPTNVWRLFGDSDGDNDVDTTDFAQFRLSYGGGASIFDFDNDGDTDTSDFGNFRADFGVSV